jgi:hypothetical protein
MAVETATRRHTELINEIKTLLWGPVVKEDVFQRWAQGKNVSDNFAIIEKTYYSYNFRFLL